jgi:hypothetical protein
VLATASAATSVSNTATPTNGSAGATELQPDLRTRATYRLLLMRGLAPDEAANLTAFMSGIHVGEQHWKLKEVNQLLFLRDMQRSGRLGESH